MVSQDALGGADRTPPPDLDSAGRPRASAPVTWIPSYQEMSAFGT